MLMASARSRKLPAGSGWKAWPKLLIPFGGLRSELERHGREDDIEGGREPHLRDLRAKLQSPGFPERQRQLKHKEKEPEELFEVREEEEAKDR